MRRVEPGVECHRYVAVETHRGVEHAVQISERDAALWHFVHDEMQCVAVEIEQHPDGAASRYAAFDAALVNGVVLKPRTLSVNVHRKSLIVFTWAREMMEF